MGKSYTLVFNYHNNAESTTNFARSHQFIVRGLGSEVEWPVNVTDDRSSSYANEYATSTILLAPVNVLGGPSALPYTFGKRSN
jgi:hypothetical protein